MIKLINSDLFSFTTTIVKDTRSDREYAKLRILCSNKLQQYVEPNDGGYGYRQNRNNAAVNKAAAMTPINREIVRLSVPTSEEFVGEDSTIATRVMELGLPMTVNVQSSGNTQNVELRAHAQGDDRASIMVVAFPFNGMIKPIPLDERYRIYKGAIVTSVRPIFHEGRRYRKILYLVINYNKNLFDPDHKYHADQIDIPLESYAIRENRDTGVTTTQHEKMTLKIVNAEGDYIIGWDTETLDEAVQIKTERGTPLWTTFQFEPRAPKYDGQNNGNRYNNGGNNDRSNGNNYRNNYQNNNRSDNGGDRNGNRSGYTPREQTETPASTGNGQYNDRRQNKGKAGYNKHGIPREGNGGRGKDMVDRFFDSEESNNRRGGKKGYNNGRKGGNRGRRDY